MKWPWQGWSNSAHAPLSTCPSSVATVDAGRLLKEMSSRSPSEEAIPRWKERRPLGLVRREEDSDSMVFRLPVSSKVILSRPSFRLRCSCFVVFPHSNFPELASHIRLSVGRSIIRWAKGGVRMWGFASSFAGTPPDHSCECECHCQRKG